MKYSNPAELANQADASIFSTKESLLKFIENPSLAVLENDPLYKFSGIMVAEAMMFGDKYVKADDQFAKNTDYTLTVLENLCQKKNSIQMLTLL